MRSIDPILGLLKKLTNSQTDKEMCKILEIPYGTLDGWKAKDEIPAKRLMEFSKKLGVGMDTLINSSLKVVGNGNIAFSGNNNIINDTKTSYSPRVDEFLELYEKYGNENLDNLLEPIIEKLRQIEKISKG